MKSCVFSLAILFLWRVEEGADACTCMDICPEQKICRSDVVIRAAITGSEDVDRGTKYYIKYVQVFEGPFIYAVYSSGPCRAFLDPLIGSDYLLTGRLAADGMVHISMCDFKKPWADLSDDELFWIETPQICS